LTVNIQKKVFIHTKMKEPKDLINWVELSRFLAGNESSVSRNRCPKKYQDKVNSLIHSIERWEKENCR